MSAAGHESRIALVRLPSLVSPSVSRHGNERARLEGGTAPPARSLANGEASDGGTDEKEAHRGEGESDEEAENRVVKEAEAWAVGAAAGERGGGERHDPAERRRPIHRATRLAENLPSKPTAPSPNDPNLATSVAVPVSSRPPTPRKRGLPVRSAAKFLKVTYAEEGSNVEFSSCANRPLTSPRKRRKTQLTYAPPETYAHLTPVADCVSSELDVLFCGYNPGMKSAERGHHFAGPTNVFWTALSLSGLTSEPVNYRDDQRLPRDFNVGITNLVPRATRSSSELSAAEMRDHAVELRAKILKLRPRVVCFVGDGVYKAFNGRPKRNWGRQMETVTLSPAEPCFASHSSHQEVVLFVMPSTSGRTVSISREAKVQYFKQLKKLRDELLAVEGRPSPRSSATEALNGVGLTS